MRKGRKFLCLLLCAVLLLSMSAAALGANNKYSSWFQTNYDEINKLGLMPESFNGLDLTKNITRGEMCELAVYAFEKATGNDIDMSNETFSISDASEVSFLTQTKSWMRSNVFSNSEDHDKRRNNRARTGCL